MIGAVKDRPKRKRKKVLYKGVELGRWPTAFEEHVLSLSEIPKRYDGDISATVERLADLRMQFARRVFSTDDPDGLYRAALTDVREVLASAQRAIGRYGAFELTQECQRQGMEIEPVPEDAPELDALEQWMREDVALNDGLDTAANSVMEEWTASLDRAKLRARRARKDLSTVLELAESNVLWNLKTVVSRVLHAGFALSRGEAMTRIRKAATRDEVHLAREVDEDRAEELVDYVIQSAVLDKNTCEPCADADGLTFEYGDDDMLEYEPPYFRCLGGDLCRCTQIYVLKGGGSWVVRDGSIL
jgi:hypothetical protein